MQETWSYNTFFGKWSIYYAFNSVSPLWYSQMWLYCSY